MENERVFIALGSNLGDREKYLSDALESMQQKCAIIRKSSIYETAPMYVTDQPEFLNQVIEISTDLEPHALLKFLQSIENQLGRRREQRYGPRTIDLDIIFYGQRIVNETFPKKNARGILENSLAIPHPLMHERSFVLAPLAEIAPRFVHPALKKSVKELLDVLPPAGGDVRLFARP